MRNGKVMPLASGLLVLTALLSLGGCIVAPAQPPYYEREAVLVGPPPPRVEYVGPPPAVGYLWIDGRWDWVGHRYEWAPGRWEAPRPGYRWVPHRWEHEGSQWRQHGGRWERH